MSNEKVFSNDNFQTEVLEARGPVLVDFWAEWCGPCRMLGPVVAKIADANVNKVKVGKINVDDNKEMAQKYGVQGIPTILFFKDGEVAKQLVGFQSQENIQKVIDEL
jgi:thioredoxin 1